MFKKVVIADSLAPLVNDIFGNYQEFGGGALWLGAIYFAFQIYCDFSGYSDIAIGISKLFGFELMSNFKVPYFSRNIGEFWRRWHISLSTWFRDYLYIPLGGSKEGKWKSLRNVFIIFLVSGFWHGANWTFIVWGLFHSILFIPSFVFKTNRKFVSSVIAENSFMPSLKELFQVLITFLLVTIGWVFFRSETIGDSFNYLNFMFTSFNINSIPVKGLFYIIILLFFDFVFKNDSRNIFENLSTRQKHLTTMLFIIMICVHLSNNKPDFIYFQF